MQAQPSTDSEISGLPMRRKRRPRPPNMTMSIPEYGLSRFGYSKATSYRHAKEWVVVNGRVGPEATDRKLGLIDQQRAA